MKKDKDPNLVVDELLQLILEEIDIGIHVVNHEGKTIVYNRKMMEIEMMNEEDVLHKNLLDVFTFQNNQSSTLLEALQKGKIRKNIKQSYFNNRGKEVTTINDTYPIMKDNKIVGAIEMVRDVTELKQSVQDGIMQNRNTRYTFEQLIGESPSFKIIIDDAKRSARTSSSVLLIGETGTGKELFAQSIHNASHRSTKPFISQNCAALPETLIESILFGTKKGAFTGAIDKPGLFEEANGGTLLLDEINSLSPNLQAKLLRVLQDRKVRRIGDMTEKELDVRIIATINEDPIEAIANNHLRKDLYYRLSVVSLFLPPLRERKEDILLLANFFIQKYNRLFGLTVTKLDDHVAQFFLQHNWPGNIRELEHMIEGAMNLVENETTITSFHLPTRFFNEVSSMNNNLTKPLEKLQAKKTNNENQDDHFNLKSTLLDKEKQHILTVLSEQNGNITKAAKILGISRQNLQYRIRKFNITNEK
ncbi:sigma-54 interaction domain-containing protein [Gottfriedia solisilvae]|uniref:Sigma-54-dependent Fis family transcriptional regulator n=1 Tax=Gottfriedia solisilvae TaxID=1516104 RepID=A0A8J3AVT0_9BACI|nr:sigma 54-interacting transcriptional regulator [Gottfriedia solisilvae]GGI17501.1 sigma-54-dependent Fis family transcriptional regulator [Gottfriedia solisilvae]